MYAAPLEGSSAEKRARFPPREQRRANASVRRLPPTDDGAHSAFRFAQQRAADRAEQRALRGTTLESDRLGVTCWLCARARGASAHAALRRLGKRAARTARRVCAPPGSSPPPHRPARATQRSAPRFGGRSILGPTARRRPRAPGGVRPRRRCRADTCGEHLQPGGGEGRRRVARIGDPPRLPGSNLGLGARLASAAAPLPAPQRMQRPRCPRGAHAPLATACGEAWRTQVPQPRWCLTFAAPACA